MSKQINKDMTFNEVLDMGPEMVKVLIKYNMGCVGCAAAKFESIEQGAKAHGINLDDLLCDLNTALNS